MSTGGISIGGPGGLSAGEPKITKGLSELGQAKPEDIAKFTEGLGSRSMELGTMQQTGVGAIGPMETQPTRVKDAGKFDKNISLNMRLIKDAGNVLNMGRIQESALMEKIKAAGAEGHNISQVEMIQIQKNVGDIALLTEVISKGVNKLVQGVQGVVKNQ